ncbi:30S ribosomal protein S21 [Pseudomonadota bacterium]
MVSVKVPGKSKLEVAIKIFRKKCQKAGIIREARTRKEHEKRSVKRKRKAEESFSRSRRNRRKPF